MDPQTHKKLNQRRKQRFLFAGAGLFVYSLFAGQWVFDLRERIEEGSVSPYLPLVIYITTIVLMLGLVFFHFWLEDHDHVEVQANEE